MIIPIRQRSRRRTSLPGAGTRRPLAALRLSIRSQ